MRRSVFVMLSAAGLLAVASFAAAAEKLDVLIIDGQNNHNWRATTPVLEGFLEKTGRFNVEVATTPTEKNAPQAEWDKFRPEFSKYDVVLSNYNGQMWPEEVQKSFMQYVENGGGVMIVHAANNAFSGWKEYNDMIGLGWRNNKFGPRVYYDEDGKPARQPKAKAPARVTDRSMNFRSSSATASTR